VSPRSILGGAAVKLTPLAGCDAFDAAPNESFDPTTREPHSGTAEIRVYAVRGGICAYLGCMP